MTVSEKAAYLKGLMEGMKLDEAKDETKLFRTIADLLEDLSMSVEDLEDGQAYLEEYIDELDADLGEVERDVYECDDDDDCEECYATICPECGEEVCYDPFIEADSIECPSCGAKIELDKADAEEIDAE